MEFTIEIDLPESPVEIGKVYRVGDPDFFEIFVLVDGIEIRATGTWYVQQQNNEPPVPGLIPGCRVKTLVTGIIQRGWGPTLEGSRQEIPSGTRWNTDSQWLFEAVDWTEPFVAEVSAPTEPPRQPWISFRD